MRDLYFSVSSMQTTNALILISESLDANLQRIISILQINLTSSQSKSWPLGPEISWKYVSYFIVRHLNGIDVSRLVILSGRTCKIILKIFYFKKKLKHE